MNSYTISALMLSICTLLIIYLYNPLSITDLLTEIFWNEFITVVHDEDSTHIELNVVLLLFVLKKIKRSSAGNKEQGTELQLSFHREMLQEEQADVRAVM